MEVTRDERGWLSEGCCGEGGYSKGWEGQIGGRTKVERGEGREERCCKEGR